MRDDAPYFVGHVHLKVRDLDRSVDFYGDVLGLDVTERHRRYAFLAWDADAPVTRTPDGRYPDPRHHDVALQAVGGEAGGPGAGVGLYHAAFEVASPGALRATWERARDRGVAVSPVDHGISKALYFDDPDGNGLEVYLDTREENDRRTWGGENRRFDPADL